MVQQQAQQVGQLMGVSLHDVPLKYKLPSFKCRQILRFHTSDPTKEKPSRFSLLTSANKPEAEFEAMFVPNPKFKEEETEDGEK